MTIHAFVAAVHRLQPILTEALTLLDPGKYRVASIGAHDHPSKGVIADSGFKTTSAHAALRLHALTPDLNAGIRDLHATFHGLSWANHPAQILRWNASSNGDMTWRIGAIPLSERGADLCPGPDHTGLQAFCAWACTIDHRLAPWLVVEPTHPTWKVASKPVGAPDAGSARVLAELLANPRAAIDARKPKTVHQVVPIPDVRAQTRAALALMAGAQT